MRFLIKNSHYSKNSRGIMQSFALLLCLIVSTGSFASENVLQTLSPESVLAKQASTVELTTQALQKMQVLLADHLQEWEEMKPALKRLIKSEQDLTRLVASLDKMAPTSKTSDESQQAVETEPEIKNNVKSTVQQKARKPLQKGNVVSSEKQVKAKKTSQPAPRKTTQTGIHLASYKKIKNVHRGWSILEKRFSNTLKGKPPFYYQAKIRETLYTRLVVGNFSSPKTAREVCKKLKAQGQFCQVINYTVTSNGRD